MELDKTIRILTLHNVYQRGEDISHPELHEMQYNITKAVDEAIKVLNEKKHQQEQVEIWKEVMSKTPLQFVKEEPKMSLRDEFAARALMSMLSPVQNIEESTYETAAKLSYAFADAMLKEREL